MLYRTRTIIGRALIGLGVLIVPDRYWDEMVKAIRKEQVDE